MPEDFGFEGMTPQADPGAAGSSGMFWQDPQLRDALARIMQTKQGLPPGAGQMPGGAMSDQDMRAMQPQVPQVPGQMPGGVPQMPGAVPEPPPSGAGQPPFPASPDPRYTPEVEKRMQQFIAEPPGARRQPRTDEENRALEQLLQQEQRRSQFGLPVKTARAKEFGVDDFGDPRDIVGRGDGSGTA